MNTLLTKFQTKEKGRIVFFVLCLFLILFFLYKVPRISVPLAVAYVFYMVISPFVPPLAKIGLGRKKAAYVVFIGFILLFTVPFIKGVPVVIDEVERFQFYKPKIEKFVRDNYFSARQAIFDRTGYSIQESYLQDGIEVVKKETGSVLLNIPKHLASVTEWFFLVPFFLFFMLRDGRTVKRSLVQLAPNSFYARFYLLYHKFNLKLGDYIFAKFIEASIVGFIITTGLATLGMKFSLTLGITAAITNIIPYIGPFLGMIPGVILALAEYGFESSTFWAIFFLYLIANAVDLAIVFPILVSKIVDLHPVIVVVSVVLGSQYFGIAGMIVSIPFAAALKLIFDEVLKEFYSSQR